MCYCSERAFEEIAVEKGAHSSFLSSAGLRRGCAAAALADDACRRPTASTRSQGAAAALPQAAVCECLHAAQDVSLLRPYAAYCKEVMPQAAWQDAWTRAKGPHNLRSLPQAGATLHQPGALILRAGCAGPVTWEVSPPTACGKSPTDAPRQLHSLVRARRQLAFEHRRGGVVPNSTPTKAA